MSEIRATTISDLVGTGPVTLTGQSAAKAYGLFDQRGSVLGTATAGADSLLISSVTDVAEGLIEVTLAVAMNSAEYSISATSHYSGVTVSSTPDFCGPAAQTVSSVDIGNAYQNGALRDGIYWYQFFGDLA